MLLEFFIWLLCFSLFTALLLLLNYWLYLFHAKDSYTREEILRIPSILKQECMRLLSGQNTFLRLSSFAGGALSAWVLCFLGGLLSPDISPAPDYASDQIPNYFFQSVLFLFVLHLIWPSIRSSLGTNDSQTWQSLLQMELPFFLSLGAGLAALNLSLWGIYHEMYFLYAAINSFFCLSYAFYRLREEEKKAASMNTQENTQENNQMETEENV